MWYPYRVKTKLDSYFPSVTTVISRWIKALDVKDTSVNYLGKDIGGYIVPRKYFLFVSLWLNTQHKMIILATFKYTVQ